MIKRSIAVIAAVLLILVNAGCQNTVKTYDDRINITVSFNAIKEFAEAVGRDRVNVSVMVPDGSEAHDFEPSAKDIAELSKTDIFIYNGLGMESWADDSIKAAKNGDLIDLRLSDGFQILTTKEGGNDPHVWLSLNGAKYYSEKICDALISIDPKNETYYRQNFDGFNAQCQKVLDEYKRKFEGLPKRDFVTGHAAFGYLCRDFSLNQVSVSGVFSEGEPGAKKLTEMVDFCRQNNIKTIFHESALSPAVANTLANEVGATVETVFTVETSENGESYLSRMVSNLEKIYASLK